MKSIQHNTKYLIGANSLQVSLSLLLSIFLARYFDEKLVFGKYQQLFIIINFLVAFTSGIPLGLSYFYGKYLDYTNRIKIYKRFGWSIVLLALLLGGFVIYFNNIFVKVFQNNYFEDYVYLFGCLLIFKIINSYFLQFNLTRGKLPYYFLVIFIEFVATVILIIGIYKLNLEVKSILILLISIAILKFILFGLNAFMLFKVKGPIILTKQEWNYILPLTAISMASILTVYVDKFMISSMLNPKNFAEYQVGAFSIPFIGIVTGSVVTALIPALARLKSEGKIDDIVLQMLMATKKTSLFLLPILVYCILMGKHLITTLYSDAYESSGYIFQLYTASYLLTVIAFSAVMNAIGLQKWVLLNTLINLFLNITLNLVLIPIYGTYGAVYATLSTTYLGYFLPIFLLKKHIHISFFEYFPIKFYTKILLISIFFGGFLYLTVKLLELNKWSIVFAAFPFYLVVLLIGADGNTKNIPIIQKLKKIIGRK